MVVLEQRRTFASVGDAKERFKRWREEVANVQINGTLKERLSDHFRIERILPLPLAPRPDPSSSTKLLEVLTNQIGAIVAQKAIPRTKFRLAQPDKIGLKRSWVQFLRDKSRRFFVY